MVYYEIVQTTISFSGVFYVHQPLQYGYVQRSSSGENDPLRHSFGNHLYPAADIPRCRLDHHRQFRQLQINGIHRHHGGSYQFNGQHAGGDLCRSQYPCGTVLRSKGQKKAEPYHPHFHVFCPVGRCFNRDLRDPWLRLCAENDPCAR